MTTFKNKTKMNYRYQYYKGIPIRLINRSYKNKNAKRYIINGTNQNVWIPNNHLEDDGTIKNGENIDYVFRKSVNQLTLAGITQAIIGIKRKTKQVIEIRYKFTDKELKQALNNLTILVDTREQKNEHILDAFNKLKVNYKVQKLDFGDYSCFIPKGSFEGQARDIYFTNDIAIERKASIDELAGNLKDDATRIRTELAHINKYNIKCYLFVEDYLFDKHIREGNYRSQYTPKTLYKRLKKQIEARYSTLIRPVHKDYIGSEIYNTLESYVYEKFRHEGWIEGVDVNDQR